MKALNEEDGNLGEEEEDAESPQKQSDNPTVAVIADTQRKSGLIQTELASHKTTLHAQCH